MSEVKRTGYEIELKDFIQLLTYPEYRDKALPALAEWFGWKPDPHDHARVVSESGVSKSAKEMHEEIQTDPASQRRVYNLAMSLWR